MSQTTISLVAIDELSQLKSTICNNMEVQKLLIYSAKSINKDS